MLCCILLRRYSILPAAETSVSLLGSVQSSPQSSELLSSSAADTCEREICRGSDHHQVEITIAPRSAGPRNEWDDEAGHNQVTVATNLPEESAIERPTNADAVNASCKRTVSGHSSSLRKVMRACNKEIVMGT